MSDAQDPPDFQQLLTELADYRVPDTSITQDSVMALASPSLTLATLTTFPRAVASTDVSSVS